MACSEVRHQYLSVIGDPPPHPGHPRVPVDRRGRRHGPRPPPAPQTRRAAPPLDTAGPQARYRMGKPDRDRTRRVRTRRGLSGWVVASVVSSSADTLYSTATSRLSR